MIITLSIIAPILTVLGMWLLSQRNRWGFIVSLVNQIPWTLLTFYTESWGLLSLVVAMTFINVRGWRNWGSTQVRDLEAYQLVYDIEDYLKGEEFTSAHDDILRWIDDWDTG